MIKTTGDLIQALKKEEERKIASFQPISHGPTIGAMYEGATSGLLKKAVFEGLDLSISNGFIKNSKNELSKQIDCMIVTGSGSQVPYTQNYIFDISNVIAIVEVKKNLYGADLEDAMDWSRDFQRRIWEPPAGQKISLLRDAWKSITKTELPKHEQASSLPYHLEMLYHTLVVETSSPLRIFLGYEGYVNEYGFRRGLINYLQGLVDDGKQHLGGPLSLPDIMICRDSSIFKLNGTPYPGPLKENFWLYLASRGVNPLHILLELLWTRLSYKFGISSDIFGEDLETEGVNPLLRMKAVQQDTKQGWAYETFELSEERLKEGNKNKDWEPVEISAIEGELLLILGKKNEIRDSDPDFIEFLHKKGVKPSDIIKSLVENGLIYYQNGIIKYLTDECVIINLPDGRAVAGDNKSGQMTRWMIKHQQGNKGTM